jgi:hypothetical protein
MYVNEKVITVESILGMGERREQKRMVEGVNSSMLYLIYCKEFFKCHNVPSLSTTIKNSLCKKNKI